MTLNLHDAIFQKKKKKDSVLTRKNFLSMLLKKLIEKDAEHDLKFGYALIERHPWPRHSLGHGCWCVVYIGCKLKANYEMTW